jgi:hypothetical protein
VKKTPLKLRSMKSIVSAASIAGPATTMTQLDTEAETLNIGRRLQARPGARIFEIVTIRFTDWSVNASADSPTAVIHTSGPLFEMNAVSESGGSALNPDSGGV